MSQQTPIENNSPIHAAQGNLAFLLSVIRCGESLSDAEEANVRKVIRDLDSFVTAPPPTAVIASFKVGDRIRQKYSSWPDATVTEITERGFKYEYDTPVVLSPRLGSMTGGEAYRESFGIWEVVSAPLSHAAAIAVVREMRYEWLQTMERFEQAGKITHATDILCCSTRVQFANEILARLEGNIEAPSW